MIGKWKSIFVGLFLVCILCFGLVVLLLNLNDIERAWTRRKIPEAEKRFQQALEDVTSASSEHELLDSGITYYPYVPSFGEPVDCIMAHATYVFGTNTELDNMLASYKAYFQDRGYIPILTLENGYLAFRNPRDTVRFDVLAVSDKPAEWSKFDVVYKVLIAYKEPSVEYCSGRPKNDLNET